jgi:hypothetical protein
MQVQNSTSGQTISCHGTLGAVHSIGNSP